MAADLYNQYENEDRSMSLHSCSVRREERAEPKYRSADTFRNIVKNMLTLYRFHWKETTRSIENTDRADEIRL